MAEEMGSALIAQLDRAYPTSPRLTHRLARTGHYQTCHKPAHKGERVLRAQSPVRTGSFERDINCMLFRGRAVARCSLAWSMVFNVGRMPRKSHSHCIAAAAPAARLVRGAAEVADVLTGVVAPGAP